MNLQKNNLFLFWNIGKNVYEDRHYCDNVIKKYSDYCSYYYGNSIMFSRESIHLMKRFYMNFPIFQKELEKISWDQYQLLLKIPNQGERYFYFYLSLLFQSDYEETLSFIQNQYFFRI